MALSTHHLSGASILLINLRSFRGAVLQTQALKVPGLRVQAACGRGRALSSRTLQQVGAESSADAPASDQPLYYGQDRVTLDGRLLPPRLFGGNRRITYTAPDTAAGPPPRGLAPAAPHVPPISDAQLARLVDFVHAHRNILVITGAGCSTESNVPDYRGPRGAYSTGFTPMTHQKFMSGPEAQARYWARSFAGWYGFASLQPNAAHEGIAQLQARGWLGPLVTQNVDRLHTKAGSAGVIELHGTTHEVICTSCGALTCRHEFQRTLAALNPEAEAAALAMQRGGDSAGARRLRTPGIDEEAGAAPTRRPDGDIELATSGRPFAFPPCTACGGVLKPDVVFFGDGVPKARAERTLALAASCDALLVVGSSLMVYSAFRLVRTVVERSAPVAVVTAGPTRADELLDLKVEARAGEVLTRMARHPALALPRL